MLDKLQCLWILALWESPLIGLAPPANFQFFAGGNSGSNGNWGRVTSANTAQLNADVSSQSWGCFAKIKLTGKPTNALVSNDSGFATFDEALESIPVIKVYNDLTSGSSVAINPATPSFLGTIQLSSSICCR